MGREWEAQTLETRFLPPRQMPAGIQVKLLGMAGACPPGARPPGTPCAHRLLCAPTSHSCRHSSQMEVLGAPPCSEGPQPAVSWPGSPFPCPR